MIKFINNFSNIIGTSKTLTISMFILYLFLFVSNLIREHYITAFLMIFAPTLTSIITYYVKKRRDNKV